jgi:hypothetical protein
LLGVTKIPFGLPNALTTAKEANKMNATFIVGLWMIFGSVTLVLAIYRWVLSAHNENIVHLGAGGEKEIPRQISLERKIHTIDNWGKAMTVLTAVVGLGLATAYLYQAWESPNPGPNNFYRNNSPDNSPGR